MQRARNVLPFSPRTAWYWTATGWIGRVVLACPQQQLHYTSETAQPVASVGDMHSCRLNILCRLLTTETMQTVAKYRNCSCQYSNLINKQSHSSKKKFLYSAVSSPQDRSKRFTLYFPDRRVHSRHHFGFSG